MIEIRDHIKKLQISKHIKNTENENQCFFLLRIACDIKRCNLFMQGDN